MTVHIDHWLGEAEQVRFTLPPANGATATVFVLRIRPESWRAAWCTSAPGHQGRGQEQFEGIAWPNRHNAILSGLISIRDHWQKQGIPVLIAAAQRLIDGWEY